MHPTQPWRVRARPAAILVALALVAGACAASPAPSATTGQPPSGSIVPSATGTPGPASPPSGGAPTPSSAAAWPLTLVDDEGTAVVIAARPARIVSLTPATTEILFAVGAGPRVVATTDFDDYPPAALGLAHVASYQGVDVEKIVGLGADLVVAGGNGFNSPAAIARLRSLGIPVLVVYAPDVAGVMADVALVAAAAGEAGAGAVLAASMQADIQAVSAAVAAGSAAARPRVFYELDATREIYGPADGSFVAAMVGLAGGDPITTGSPTVFSIPLERLVAADPQVIVLGDAAYGVTPGQVAERPGWGSLTAVREGAVRPVDDVLVTRPGPRLPAGLRALAAAIHPGIALPPAVAAGAP